MSVYSNPWEIDAIRGIIKEVREKHSLAGKEQLISIVATEAQCCGIKCDISAPIARKLIDKNDIFVP
ncbi:MAG: hypothetical protein JXC85_01830 [Candidatus Aenigmarchaeota archaeon]|nr:hypothetical protein [Candidatus Aenigmarchaeota archaeon]